MRFRLLVLGGAALLLAACGSVAETQPTFEPTSTSQPRLVLVEEEGEETVAESEATEEAVAVEPTVVPPTATPSPEPTAVPTLAEPTAVPTEVPTEEAAVPADSSEAGRTVVVIDGQELTGYAEDGKFWFDTIENTQTTQKCITCHNPDAPVHGVGPYLYGIANAAGSRVEGMNAVDYLHEAIVNPNAHIAPPQISPDGQEFPWPPNLMPQNWEEQLEPYQIADIIAYLMTLNQELPAE
ncbi:MAG: c-type cytochrome [Anaerolineae bacterium]|nr:c-type cytochrome [Anaerolineae bacterium]